MDFEIVGAIAEIETIATGRGIRQLAELRRQYGAGRWRKLRGVATKGFAICADNRGRGSSSGPRRRSGARLIRSRR